MASEDKEKVIEEMDGNAIDAQNDFAEMVDTEMLEKSGLIEWWNKWYGKAGHKRLGRILLGKF